MLANTKCLCDNSGRVVWSGADWVGAVGGPENSGRLIRSGSPQDDRIGSVLWPKSKFN